MEENEKLEHQYVPGSDMQAAFVPPVDGKHIQRERPDPDPARAALVTKLCERIQAARRHWKPKFDQMRKNQRFVHGKQWPGQDGSNDENRYVVNLALSHINQRVSAIYAKNPRVVGKAKSRMWFSVWDGKTESWQAAQQAVETMGPQAPPQVIALIEDIRNGMIRKEQAERIADRLADRDYDRDDRRMCLECASYAQDRSCLAARRGLLHGVVRPIEPIPNILHRCHRFEFAKPA